ncbi:hypothetical protein K402DRAFT_390498 [Aulographum hederae CBS 113979]|uniref:N-acetyltransferase domain-containing protein n=1 Tax=Aulographum hederae CBS 113979 TaxID=1176131 RepID=A0A6G1H933_9PEZI|nr:hypothetical protein K402DRAFT_390498 [Aulographum hederae CBS 113979]
MKPLLSTNEGGDRGYKVAYVVHKFHSTSNPSVETDSKMEYEEDGPADLMGMVTLRSLGPESLALPEHLTLPASAASSTLTIEIAYSFLPDAWGKGYATESSKAVLEASKTARAYWTPFSKLYVRSIVNGRNPASIRVMEKTAMVKRGIYVWTGKPIFIGGEWRGQDDLHIFGMYLME